MRHAGTKSNLRSEIFYLRTISISSIICRLGQTQEIGKGSKGGNISTGENRSAQTEPIPAPLCPSQIPLLPGRREEKPHIKLPPCNVTKAQGEVEVQIFSFLSCELDGNESVHFALRKRPTELEAVWTQNRFERFRNDIHQLPLPKIEPRFLYVLLLAYRPTK